MESCTALFTLDRPDATFKGTLKVVSSFTSSDESDTMFDEASAPGDVVNDSESPGVAFNLAVAVNVTFEAVEVVCRYAGVSVEEGAVDVSPETVAVVAIGGMLDPTKEQ